MAEPTAEPRPVALVTGASRGLGKASALALAHAGYDLAITARTLVDGDRRLEGDGKIVVPGGLDTTGAATNPAAEQHRGSIVPAQKLTHDHHLLNENQPLRPNPSVGLGFDGLYCAEVPRWVRTPCPSFSRVLPCSAKEKDPALVRTGWVLSAYRSYREMQEPSIGSLDPRLATTNLAVLRVCRQLRGVDMKRSRQP